MTGDLFLVVSENRPGISALGLLTLALLLTLVRLVRGPTLADRVAVARPADDARRQPHRGICSSLRRVGLQLDIALALCLVGFVSTIALSRFC